MSLEMSLTELITGRMKIGGGKNEHEKIAEAIVAHLNYCEFQRLHCVCHEFTALLSQNDAVKTTSVLLRDLEVLRCLQCPRWLRRKILNAIRTKQYRIMKYEHGAQELPEVTSEKTMFDVFDDMSFWSCLFGSEDFLFASVHPLDLIERGQEVGDAFDDIFYDTESYEYKVENLEPPQKKQRMLECSSSFCKENSVSRVYYVNGSAYCGQCMDGCCFLKLLYCAEHYSAHETTFEAKELAYNNPKDSPQRWGLGDEEFWVQLWYSAPYNYGEVRFVGAGPRRSFR